MKICMSVDDGNVLGVNAEGDPSEDDFKVCIAILVGSCADKYGELATQNILAEIVDVLPELKTE